MNRCIASRLKPYEKYAEMIDRHWDGIAAYCHSSAGALK
jgi:hypothetical protein